MQINRKKLVFGASTLALAIGSPLAFSPAQGVTVNDACAQTGTCCTSGDMCIVNGVPIAAGYWSGSGAKCE